MCIGNNRVAKDNFPLTMFETDSKYDCYYHLTLTLLQFPQPSSRVRRP